MLLPTHELAVFVIPNLIGKPEFAGITNPDYS